MKVNDTGAKVLGIGCLATIAGIATAPIMGGAMLTGGAAYLVWGVVLGSSIGIANIKMSNK